MEIGPNGYLTSDLPRGKLEVSEAAFLDRHLENVMNDLVTQADNDLMLYFWKIGKLREAKLVAFAHDNNLPLYISDASF